MIPAKEIDGELWIKASDHHQAIKEALAQPKRSIKVEGPLHVVCQCDKCQAKPVQIAVNPEYIAFMDVPYKPWVGLTDGVMCDIAIKHGLMNIDWIDFARDIETKLRSKNEH